jgi:hypothetical protein
MVCFVWSTHENAYFYHIKFANKLSCAKPNRSHIITPHQLIPALRINVSTCTFYEFDEDSKRMKLQTMEDPYPKLSQLDDDRNQYYTFQFTNASEIFYDPSILQKLQSLLSFFRPPRGPPIFQKAFTLDETFTRGDQCGRWWVLLLEIG